MVHAAESNTWEEARSKAEESEKECLSETKAGLETLANELEECVTGLHKENPDKKGNATRSVNETVLTLDV